MPKSLQKANSNNYVALEKDKYTGQSSVQVIDSSESSTDIHAPVEQIVLKANRNGNNQLQSPSRDQHSSSMKKLDFQSDLFKVQQQVNQVMSDIETIQMVSKKSARRKSPELSKKMSGTQQSPLPFGATDKKMTFKSPKKPVTTTNRKRSNSAGGKNKGGVSKSGGGNNNSKTKPR